mgnify:CR=1 FL=1
MTRKNAEIGLGLFAVLMVLTVSTILTSSTYAQQGLYLLWTIPTEIDDVAVSADGRYIAAISGDTLMYYQVGSSDPLWTASNPDIGYFSDVAISADGECVVVGNDAGCIRYFKDATSRSGSSEQPTWRSQHLGGSVTLDISDNGEYVAFIAGGSSVYYFTGCKSKSGLDIPPDLTVSTPAAELGHLDMTPDGRYIAVGGYILYEEEGDRIVEEPGESGYVAYIDISESSETPTWSDEFSLEMIDIAISDDGYGVVAAFEEYRAPGEVAYWADAYDLSGSVGPTWTGGEDDFTCVAVSGDGNLVAAGAYSMPKSLHVWSEARALSGSGLEPDWSKPLQVLDVAVSRDGSVIAVSTEEADGYYLRIFNSDGAELDFYRLDSPGNVVSMSSDGSVIAVGGGAYDSLYVFKYIPPRPVGGPVLPTVLATPVFKLALAAVLALAVAVAYMVLRRGA